METMENKINEVMDALIYLTSKDQYAEEIENAHELFNKGLDEESFEMGFNFWLILEYTFKNGSSFINELMLKNELDQQHSKILTALKDSFISIFEVKKTEREVFLKDIFTNNDYPIENYNFEAEELVSTRIVTIEGNNYITDELTTWESRYKSSIKKSILEKYNEYSKQNKHATLEYFIKNNALLIYKFLIILKNSEVELVFQDEEFYVFQSIYVIKDHEGFNQIIKKSKQLETHPDYDGEVVMLKEDDLKISEIVIKNEKIEVECTSKEELKEANTLVEEVFGDTIQKVKDEVLNIEDLL